jgi:hypothetical protein
LQLLLGFLELGDVAHHHHQPGWCRVEGFGGDQAGESWPLLRRKASPGCGCCRPAGAASSSGRCRDAPDIQLGGGLADDLFGLQADLFFEGFVDLQQAAIGQACDHQDVRALLEHRGELLLGQAQRFFGALGFADVDHQPRITGSWPCSIS